MREVLPALLAAVDRGEETAMAVVVRTRGSAPRPPGAALGRTSGGVVVGSVSSGCAEGALLEAAAEVIATGRPRLLDIDGTDEGALAGGLPCGGGLTVLVTPVNRDTWPDLACVVASLDAGDAVAVAVRLPGPSIPGPGSWLVVRPDGMAGTVGDPCLDATVALAAAAAPDRDEGTVVPAGEHGEAFVSVLVPPPRLVVVGATAPAAALAQIGRLLGYRVSVVDPRPAFATSHRVPHAHEVIAAWPQRWLAGEVLDPRSAVCVLSHDARIDVPVLAAALRSPAGYVGLMGSRRTQSARIDGLRAAGVPEPDIRRLRGPIGLDVGARTPQEIAVAVAAELVACRRGGSGLPLSGTRGTDRPLAVP